MSDHQKLLFYCTDISTASPSNPFQISINSDVIHSITDPIPADAMVSILHVFQQFTKSLMSGCY